MLSATMARKGTEEAAAHQREQVGIELDNVISAAVAQGSFKATYYPKNSAVAVVAEALLKEHCYGYQHVPATDQRDRQSINITWG